MSNVSTKVAYLNRYFVARDVENHVCLYLEHSYCVSDSESSSLAVYKGVNSIAWSRIWNLVLLYVCICIWYCLHIIFPFLFSLYVFCTLLRMKIHTLCSKKSDAKFQITITTAYLIRINYPLSSSNYRLFCTNVATFNEIYHMVSEQQLFQKWNLKTEFSNMENTD